MGRRRTGICHPALEQLLVEELPDIVFAHVRHGEGDALVALEDDGGEVVLGGDLTAFPQGLVDVLELCV